MSRQLWIVNCEPWVGDNCHNCDNVANSCTCTMWVRPTTYLGSTNPDTYMWLSHSILLHQTPHTTPYTTYLGSTNPDICGSHTSSHFNSNGVWYEVPSDGPRASTNQLILTHVALTLQHYIHRLNISISILYLSLYFPQEQLISSYPPNVNLNRTNFHPESF